jgi:dTDP-4-amino-4,6-dideoxygalactose transaminase
MTQDDELAAALRSITNHGQAERYTFQQVGVNSRLDTMQAAILQVKLQYLDTYSARRQQAARYYDHALADVPHLELPKRMPYSTHVYHQYTLKVRDGLRDGLKAHLHEHGIPSVVFYPRPAHLQPAYEQLGYRAGDFPVSEQLSAEVLSLPMHSELSEEQLRYITTTLRRYLTS